MTDQAKEREDDMQLIHEDCLGIDNMTEEMERAFLASCAHNNTTPENMKYFRDYVWANLAIIAKRVQALEYKAREEGE